MSSSACWPAISNGACVGVLAPILFDDHDRAGADAQRNSPGAKARVSEAAKRKAQTKRTDDDLLPVHGVRSLIADPATFTRNQVLSGNGQTALATPNPTQSTPTAWRHAESRTVVRTPRLSREKPREIKWPDCKWGKTRAKTLV